MKLQLAQTISSSRAHKNDPIASVVADDVVVGGFTVIQAGALAEGSVVGVKGMRPLGLGGGLIIKLDSAELTSGEKVGLFALKKYKGKSHTIRMGIAMAVAGAIYLPAASVILLSRGRDFTLLKGAVITAYTRSDSLLQAADFPIARKNASELSEMMERLPPRVLNGEGREGDMLDLIFLARDADLKKAFAQAGWLKVEKSKPQIFWHLLWQRTHYRRLPMDRLYVFGRPQDLSLALPDPASIVARRHHLRIWKTDRVVDGVPLWVGAATHDVAIPFVKHKFRLFHRIDPNVDAERDFIAANLAGTEQFTHQEYVRCADPVFSAHTATGQSYYSDSRMLLLDLGRATPSVARTAEVAVTLP